MKNWFYRLQMKNAGGDGIRIAESMLEQRLITSDLNFAGEQFNHLKEGDVILIHKGAFPISLVKVISKIDDDKLSDKSFGIDYAVEILSEYDNLTEQEKSLIDLWGNTPPTGTFFKINSGTITFDRINTWYKMITKHEEMIGILDIINFKKQIILQGPPGTGKTFTAKDIAEQILFSKVSDDKKQQKALLESTDQFKLIQFHPAYSYEDFVRGIVAENKGTQIDYVTQDKVLARFAKQAYQNWVDSAKIPEIILKEKWFNYQLMNYIAKVDDELNDKGEYMLHNSNSFIKKTFNNKLIYSSKDYYVNAQGFEIAYIDLMNIFFNTTFDSDYSVTNIPDSKHYRKLVIPLLEDLRTFIKEIPDYFDNQVEENKLLNYVLIIDEINRANLPAVLGELIYALEYRGEKVESMYAIDDDNTIVIPPNLYIIGTMNTSDRSVGHIDYAIRRRFAFIDILPKILEGDDFELELFKKVSALFIENFDEYVINNGVELRLSDHLSEEFRPEDVWLGHSYFIRGTGDFTMRKKYEIVPILKEYVKDGILKQSAMAIINAL